MRSWPGLLLMLALPLLAPPLAGAADVPVAGHVLKLRASATRPEMRRANLELRDAAIAAPFADPRLGSRLVLSGGAADGQCFVEIPLDPAGWSEIAGDGPGRGYRYRVAAPGTQGVRSITLRSGRIVVRAKGGAWPCALGAPAQRVPVTAELRTDDVRYCATFGGAVRRNQAGLFEARAAPALGACPARDVTLANLNLLHGLGCPPDACRQSDRINLLFEWVRAAGCPDLVTLQEIWVPMVPQLEAQLATVCPFTYEMVYQQTNSVDDAVLLTRFPAAAVEVVKLFQGFRNVLWARLDHPLGPLDVFTTHLAASVDGGNNLCTVDCPSECVAAGVSTWRDCQAVQTALLVEARHDVSPPAVVTGDFNAPPDSFVYGQFADRGWVDTYRAAGGPECDASTGVGCTSGRESSNLSELESTAANVVERIDYVFLVPPAVASCAVEALGDADGDGTTTQIFADVPNPFAPSCGPAPDPICWPSDHEGNELDLNCD